MKIENAKNNVENKININGSTWSSTPTMNLKKDGVGVDDHIDPKDKGITLIALIITIILMLILAGVVVSLALGENGLFKTASGAAQKYKLEEMREKIELAITDVITKELVLGNEITVENVLQELLENGTFETIDKEAGIGTIDKYDITLKKNENGSIVIESIEETTGVRITYKLDPISYTNKEKITIQFKAVGEVKSVTKPDGDVAYPSQGRAEINYQVDKNGTYKFIVENKEGTLITKEVLVDTIDRLHPLAFEITAKDTLEGLKISAKTEDTDSDGVSAKSGMDRYEYYVKKEGEVDYTKYDTNEIAGLTNGTYKIYVKAYDKAGNDTPSPEITVKITVKIDKVSAGSTFSLAIDTKGNIWEFGSPTNGVLTDGTPYVNTPVQKKPGTKFKEIAAGDNHCLAIDEEGKLWSWGKNNDGQLGNTSVSSSIEPILVQVEENIRFKEVSAGVNISLAIDEEGNIWSWGNGKYGKLGSGNESNISVPKMIKTEKKFKKISAPLPYAAGCEALDVDGGIWGWGYNLHGQLGIGRKSTELSPVKIQRETEFKDVSAGWADSSAIDSNGYLWSWGLNPLGQRSNSYWMVY